VVDDHTAGGVSTLWSAALWSAKLKQTIVCDFSLLRPPRIFELDSGKHNVAEKTWKHNAAISATLCFKLQTATAERRD
jgi:hypothetical protein